MGDSLPFKSESPILKIYGIVKIPPPNWEEYHYVSMELEDTDSTMMPIIRFCMWVMTGVAAYYYTWLFNNLYGGVYG